MERTRNFRSVSSSFYSKLLHAVITSVLFHQTLAMQQPQALIHIFMILFRIVSLPFFELGHTTSFM